jgi:hypothetical protein
MPHIIYIYIYIYIKSKGIYQPEKLMSNGSSRHDDAAQTKKNEEPRSLQKTRLLRQGAIKQTTMIVYTTYFILKDIEEGHLLIENFVNIFLVTSVSVSLHNLLDFYNLFCLCCIVMSRRSVTH